MSIAELFESGERKQDKGHFRNLVLIARADGGVSEEEQGLLTKVGRRLGLTTEQIKDISDNPNRYPVTPPSGKEERIERFVQLCEMVTVDGDVAEREKQIIGRISIALGFTEDGFEELFHQVTTAFMNGSSRTEIIEKLTK